MDVEALEAPLRAGTRPGLVYVIPSFQNPAGVTPSRAKRERLVELATEHGFLLVEDDPYGELRFEGQAPPTHALARSRRGASSTRPASRRPWRPASASVRW